MKTLIAGSRTITDYKELCWAIVKSGFTISRVISGKAKGVDLLGERFAKEHGVPIEPFPAEWSKYGRSAGFKRNVTMVERAEQAIILWDGKSKGTRHTIDLVTKKGIPYFLVMI